MGLGIPRLTIENPTESKPRSSRVSSLGSGWSGNCSIWKFSSLLWWDMTISSPTWISNKPLGFNQQHWFSPLWQYMSGKTFNGLSETIVGELIVNSSYDLLCGLRFTIQVSRPGFLVYPWTGRKTKRKRPQRRLFDAGSDGRAIA